MKEPFIVTIVNGQTGVRRIWYSIVPFIMIIISSYSFPFSFSFSFSFLFPFPYSHHYHIQVDSGWIVMKSIIYCLSFLISFSNLLFIVFLSWSHSLLLLLFFYAIAINIANIELYTSDNSRYTQHRMNIESKIGKKELWKIMWSCVFMFD